MVFLGIILTPSLNDLFQQLTSSVEVREGTGEDVSADSPSSSLSGESTGGTEDVDEVSSGEEQLASAEAEAQLLAAVEAEAERVAAAKTEAERLAAAKAEAERLAAAKAEAERLAAAKAEAERLAAAKAEAERLAVANAEAERLAAVKAEAERLAAAKAEAARLEEERILEIGRLLTAARDAIDARRLTSPPGNNALEKINQVLTLDPDNHEVVALRSSIVDKYVELAHSALNDAEIETAKIYVIRAEGVEPEDQGINEIIARIATEEARIAQEAAAELKRRQLEEERAKRQREELNKLAKIESEMLGVSAGCFNMEVIAGGFQRVCVDGFFIGKYEVTFEQFDWYVKETGGAYPEDQGWGRGKRPVIKVSIAEAIAFAKWLSSKTGRTYRLPTEVEWEYAARAGIPAAYPWGVNVGDNLANCADCGSQWDKRMTAPVGSFGANPWGLYDTVGNVWEWTCSRYQPLPTGSERLCARDNETRSLNS